MVIAFISIIFGMLLLIWSADRFVSAAAAIARSLGIPALLIGMVIVGFGTSTPEMLISTLAALQGNSEIALGNAYGSNIVNISLILGITAVIRPITVCSLVLRKELPILSIITGLASWQIWNGELTRLDAFILLSVFGVLMGWTIWQAVKAKTDSLSNEVEQGLQENIMTIRQAIFWLILGLFLLISSSRLLVWGAVEIARNLGISDLIVGLTIVAIGTSLPELASSIAATKRGTHDIVLGNVLGSNLFNTLAVVGIAGVIHPIKISQEVLFRDIPVMAVLTGSLFILGYGWKKPGRINRLEGMMLLFCYVGYTIYLISSEIFS